MKPGIVKFGLGIAIALIYILATSCNQSEKSNDHMHTESHEEIHDQSEVHDDHADHGDHSVDQLTLHNGAKWPADAPTNKNADVIISIGDQFSKKDPKTVEDYQKFGNDVNEAINTMIRECTMKGEADMALHYWFAPILQNASDLKKTSDTNELKSIASEMNDRIHIYHQYFE